MEDANAWAHRMFGGADLGHMLRTGSLVRVAALQASAPEKNTYQMTAGDDAGREAAYRLFRNDAVDADAIFEAGARSVLEQARASKTILSIGDSTSLGYEHSAAAELGPLSTNERARHRGWLVHTEVFFDPDAGMFLGPVYQKRWVRKPGRAGKATRKKRKYEDKESYKWQEGAEGVAGKVDSAQLPKIVFVRDREADIFDYLQWHVGKSLRFVVRASHDRKIDGDADLLRPLVEAAPTVATTTASIPQRGGRSARTARLALRTVTASLVRGSARVPVNVLWAHEDNPPAGVDPLDWLLLTTEPTATPEQALAILGWYRARWTIEEFHKAWKVGCGAEARRSPDPENLERQAVLLEFVATRVMQLRDMERASPEAPCTTILPLLLWHVLWLRIEKKPLPASQPTVRWALQAIGRLAGWTNTKRGGRVGWSSLILGWQRLQDLAEGYALADGKT